MEVCYVYMIYYRRKSKKNGYENKPVDLLVCCYLLCFFLLSFSFPPLSLSRCLIATEMEGGPFLFLFNFVVVVVVVPNVRCCCCCW